MRTVTPTQLGMVGLFSVAALSAAAIGLSGAAQADPAGNNGTVKVDNAVFDDDPNNEPKVDCTFQIDWYGFDEGVDYYSDVTFEAIPPTTLPGDKNMVLKTDHVFVGGDSAAGAGSVDGLDASETYTLDVSALPPPGEQGYHVKLTIETPSSKGAVVKRKVFWVDGCTEPEPTPTTSTTSPSSTTTTTTTPPATSTTTTMTTPPLTSTTTTTTPPAPCESESDDDDCGVVTTPPVFAG